MEQLSGKVAVITGAASGIGRALAQQCAGAGMSLALADINGEPLKLLATQLQTEQSDTLAVATDVTDPAAVEQLAERSYERFGRVDMLFNNAGVLQTGYSWDASPQDWRWILDINLMGVVHGIRSFVPRLVKQGGESRIINTASVGALLVVPMMAQYSVSKVAVRVLTETLQMELQALHPEIGVSLLCPGPVATAIADTARSRDRAGSTDEAMEQGLLKEASQEFMAAEECARITLEGVRRKQFWIFTHPELKEACRNHLQETLTLL